VKTSIRFVAPTLIAVAAVTLAISGCSAGPLPGAGSTTGAGAGAKSSTTSAQGGGGGSSSQTYSADNLVTILTKAESTIGTGTIKNNTQLVADLKDAQSDGSLSAGLTAGGGTIVPASCGTELDKTLDTESTGFGVGPNGIAAELNYDKGILAVISVSQGSLPSDVNDKLLTSTQQLFKDCATMTITGGATTLTMDIDKISVSTDASDTYAFSETIKATGVTASSTTIIEAVSGNLLIADTAIGGTQQDAVNAINAVIAAAKG
jgi:hypothetical protein